MAEILSERSGVLDLTLEEGTDFTLPLVWKDENGVLIDLTGYTAALQLRPSPKDNGTPLLSVTESSGIALGGVLGTIDITITKAQNIFGCKSMVYDLEMTSSGGTTIRLLRGSVTSLPEVTK